MAQHGQFVVYQKELQALAGRAFHAGDHQEGNFWLTFHTP